MKAIRKIGDIVITVFGWAGIIDKIYASKNKKTKYRIVDKDCRIHCISEDCIM